MKKLFLSLLIIFCLIASNVFAVDASELIPINIDGYTIVTFDDGSVLKISPIIWSEENFVAYSTEKTISGHKTASFTDSSGNLEWQYTLYATFSYIEGVSATCTNTYYTHNIYASGWSFSDGAATTSGNVAQGLGIFVKKFLFITTKTYNIDISITCDIYGNVT